MYSVLHVDNSEVFRKVMKKNISNYDIDYNETCSIQNATTILQDKEVNLIISGMELEDGSGEQLVKKINESNFKNIPIIMVTSNESINIRKKMFDLGVVDYVLKDTPLEQIINYIEKIKEDDEIKKKLSTMHIAVLDDSVTVLEIIKKIFNFNNINNVDYYAHPDDLLKSKKKYQIYLLDINLPQISGNQVLFELKKQDRSCLVIAISSIDNYKVISNILLSGADDYIIKPFNTSVFMARLKTNARNLILLKDIELKNDKLKKLAVTDSLTGIYNHKNIYMKLEYFIERKSEDVFLSVLMMDIDYFKKINDTYGHQVGDEVLITTIDVIKSCISNNDIIGRYGGEEFIIIFPGLKLKEAYLKAEYIRKKIEEYNFVDMNLKVTITGGVAEVISESPLEIIKKVDQLMYKGKSLGRNQIVK